MQVQLTTIETYNKVLYTLNRLYEVCGNIRGTAFNGMSPYGYKVLEISESHMEIKCENWSNNYYNISLDPETLAIQLARIYRAELTEWTHYKAHCDLNERAGRENSLVLGETLVKVLDEELGKAWHSRPMAVYEVELGDGTKSRWLGPNADYALREAMPFIRETPVSIRFVEVPE